MAGVDRLLAVATALDALHGPTEARFLAFGTVLAKAESALAGIGGNLAALAARLEDADAADATARLEDAVGRVMALADDGDDHIRVLEDLGNQTDGVSHHLARLRKGIEEVRVLAMNAKIQASHLPSGHGDMAVFTVEIARLGALALASVDRTEARLGGLRKMLSAAATEVLAFDRAKTGELDVVRTRLQDGLGTMAQRRESAARSAARVGERTAEVAGHIAAAVGQMQINDIAAQRIAHVSAALRMIGGVLNPASGADGWLAEIDPRRRAPLAATVLRLQAVQLIRTRDEFIARVGDLAARMVHLADNARGVLAMAREAFGARGGGTSFVGELERQIAATGELLRRMDETGRTVRKLMTTTSADFAGMSDDLGTIRSIDADMRVMGLNATLRCGRLGVAGRALGVVAQELRNCSKRTEEQARHLGSALAEAMALASHLADDDAGAADALNAAALGAMEESVRALESLGTALDDALSGLDAEVATIARSLDRAAHDLDVGPVVGRALSDAAAQLEAAADELDPARSDPGAVRAEVERLLSAHYTMDSERMVHELFADDAETPSEVAPPEDDFDDVFL